MVSFAVIRASTNQMSDIAEPYHFDEFLMILL